MRPAPFGSTINIINSLRSFSPSFSNDTTIFHQKVSIALIAMLDTHTSHRHVWAKPQNLTGIRNKFGENGSITFPNGNNPPIDDWRLNERARPLNDVPNDLKCICVFDSFVIIMPPQVVPDLPGREWGAQKIVSVSNRSTRRFNTHYARIQMIVMQHFIDTLCRCRWQQINLCFDDVASGSPVSEAKHHRSELNATCDSMLPLNKLWNVEREWGRVGETAKWKDGRGTWISCFLSSHYHNEMQRIQAEDGGSERYFSSHS